MNLTKKIFVSNAISEIRNNFPNAIIEYGFKKNTNLHFFRVTPQSVYDSDAFIDLDFLLSDTFHQSGMEGELGFLSENSLIDLNPTIIDYPSEFVDLGVTNTACSSHLFNKYLVNMDILLNNQGSFKMDTLLNLSEFCEYEEERVKSENNLGNRQLAMAA